MSVRHRAANYALLTIDETPTPPRGNGSNSTAPSAETQCNNSPKLPTPLTGKWADYTPWSPEKKHHEAAEIQSDVTSVDEHNVSHEHSMDEASPQTRHITLPPQPTYNNPYTYHAIQYPTTPFGAPSSSAYDPTPPAYSAPPVYNQYPTNYEMCTCRCGQLIPVEYINNEGAAYNNTMVPWDEPEVSIPVDEQQQQQPVFAPRFGPPPPPPVKMAQLLSDHGNTHGETVRYHAVMRWYDKVTQDSVHFAPDVTPLPPVTNNEPFEKIVMALNEWWKKNFGERQANNHHAASSRSPSSRTSYQNHQPVQPIRSANLSQYVNSAMYDRPAISRRT